MTLILILLILIGFIVIATTYFKIHPFLTLLLASILSLLLYQVPIISGIDIISKGFGGILGHIGLVIVIGTIIGIILEKSGAAITLADFVIALFGKKYPTLTISLIGYIVSIPVFCDSGFVILNTLKESLVKRLNTSSLAMSTALATGLYATHNFVPPTPGPVAAAGNLNAMNHIGMIIMLGLLVAFVAAMVGVLWANSFKKHDMPASHNHTNNSAADWEKLKASYPNLPSPTQALSPIIIPILLIAFRSYINMPSKPLGQDIAFTIFTFLGHPIIALLCGLFIALPLIQSHGRMKIFSNYISDGILAAAPILLIAGAGGAFGATLKASGIGEFLSSVLSDYNIGIFLPFLIAAALKTAQGSSTVAIVTTSALLAPLTSSLGLSSDMGLVLTVLATGAGAMTISHANDSFFWVVAETSKMSVQNAYKSHTIATLIQGISAIGTIYILSLILL